MAARLSFVFVWVFSVACARDTEGLQGLQLPDPKTSDPCGGEVDMTIAGGALDTSWPRITAVECKVYVVWQDSLSLYVSEYDRASGAKSEESHLCESNTCRFQVIKEPSGRAWVAFSENAAQLHLLGLGHDGRITLALPEAGVSFGAAFDAENVFAFVAARNPQFVSEETVYALDFALAGLDVARRSNLGAYYDGCPRVVWHDGSSIRSAASGCPGGPPYTLRFTPYHAGERMLVKQLPSFGALLAMYDLGDRRMNVHLGTLPGSAARSILVQKNAGRSPDFSVSAAYAGGVFGVVWPDGRETFDSDESFHRIYFTTVFDSSGEVDPRGDVALSSADRDAIFPDLDSAGPGVWALSYFVPSTNEVKLRIGRFGELEPTPDHELQR